MTSELSFPSGERQQRVSVRHRAGQQQSATATAAAAEHAIQQRLVRSLQRREGRSSHRVASGGRVSTALGDSIAYFGLGSWIVRASIVVGIAILMTVAVASLPLRSPVRHSISGTLSVGKTPLPRASITFHRTATDGATVEPVSLTTGPDGSFTIAAEATLPAGLYAIVVDRVATESPDRLKVIPAMYRDAATTPLRVLVNEDLSGLKLSIRR